MQESFQEEALELEVVPVETPEPALAMYETLPREKGIRVEFPLLLLGRNEIGELRELRVSGGCDRRQDAGCDRRHRRALLG